MSPVDDMPLDEELPRRSRWRLAAALVLGVALLTSPFWGPRALRHLAFFRLRKVEVLGARFTPPADVLARLRVDTSRSVWDPLDELAARVEGHPQVEKVAVRRRLPGTIVVELTERRPVGFVARPDGLRAVDERGALLPLDPSRTPVSLPLVLAAAPDSGVYHLLGAMQQDAPALFARLTSLRSLGGGELLFLVADLPVRAMTSVTLARLGDIEPVERDLARRQIRAAELDLRYRDQVIARVP